MQLVNVWWFLAGLAIGGCAGVIFMGCLVFNKTTEEEQKIDDEEMINKIWP